MNTKTETGPLDPTSQRIIQAVGQRAWADLTGAEFRAYRRAVHFMDEGEIDGPYSPYHDALDRIRSGETSAAVIAKALGSHGRYGEEGDIWELYDARHATARISAGEEAAAEYRSTHAEDHAPETEGPATDFDEEELHRRDLVKPVWESRDPIPSSLGAVCFASQTSGQEIVRWIRCGAPTISMTRESAVFDLIALVDWMIDYERDLLTFGKKKGLPKLQDLAGPRRRIKMKIRRTLDKAAKLKADREEKAVSTCLQEAAAILDQIAGVIGWAAVEAATGLRHIPGTARDA
ncbi:hypothetical protein HCU64_09825 [Methylobacterium sp. C25]|uniref:hypothetical protein n=1 Tax=Methylobacterium sp. C25 TaxID=2721622 RepID=UPI001F3642B8|nr:hypothetical protein [Methylobacterium sp. C25]MCE4224049.1 hypothetical protein [Methylobacterium sp. C25]